MAAIDVLLPTCNRLTSLVMTLSGIASQQFTDLRLIVADQSDVSAEDEPVVRALRRIIEARGGATEWHHRSQLHGIAEQRDFLLQRSSAPRVLYLDDDVFMEPWVLAALARTLEEQGCAFVGAFPAGLSFRGDVRPAQQRIEFWDGPVQPEAVDPGSEAWERAQLHRAANLWHASQSLPAQSFSGQPVPPAPRPYRIAWVACCVLYDRARLLNVGGFSFWPRLPRYHSGEEVLVQNLLMRRYGGCAIAPSGTYHSELPSTVLNDRGTVDGHALDLLPELLSRYSQPPVASERVG